MPNYVTLAQERIQLANEAINAGNWLAAANYLNAASSYTGQSGNAAVQAAYNSAQQRLLDAQYPQAPTGGTTPATTTPTAGQNAPAAVGEDPVKAYYDRLRLQEQAAVRDTLSNLFNSYGLSGLYGKIVEYAQKDYSADTIMLMLRGTDEYKARFPAMADLAAKGRGITEAAYISYERTASEYEQRFGLPEGMLMGNVTNLLKNEVSAEELLDRVRLASAASITAPADFKAEMRDRFGVDQGGLTAYYLDPSVAMPLLEKQYAMAVIGTEARRQGISGISTDYLGLLENEGVTQDEAQKGFGNAARMSGFTGGAGEVASTMDLAQAVFGTSPDAAKKVERIATSRVNRFAGGGSFTGDAQGLAGLGVSST
jgi:hypothetical protein